MMISGSKYPKNIYGVPLFAKVAENQFEFEFKFKLNLKQKKKKKEKKKRRGLGHMGQPRALGAQLRFSTAHSSWPSSARGKNKKKENKKKAEASRTRPMP